MTDYQPGQRWISDAETELGLGTVLMLDERTVTVLFRASMETRTYARNNAPLSRARFNPGDSISDLNDAPIQVTGVHELESGLLEYSVTNSAGDSLRLAESEISHKLSVNTPDQRLLQGGIDKPAWFSLRLAAREHEGWVWKSPVGGLQGARISLAPHQLYIANELGKRPAPRALLADEVGLGKTIEACLVLHRRIVQGQCERALIIVPDSLIHQWLVELLRRFNLRFSIYDEERCRAIETDSPGENPFSQSQMILSSLLLLGDEQRLQQALDAGWDMLIVDEAHHLHWSRDDVSPQYRVVAELAARIDSVLLLTATPEQLGREGHFARLRLLDPERFDDLDRFIEEETHFAPVADLIEQLLDGGTVDADRLREYGIEDTRRPAGDIARQLLDLHGTSRLLFRNTRAHIAGFPERETIVHALPEASEEEPEPRTAWLREFIREMRPAKLLLICASAATAQALEATLRHRHGIRCAAFHEGMSIIQRDRAAAWFADPEDGAEILLCSEIGSEGRNFQFAHHLILFDLPANPDLLEQRIGRLDRIGQSETIRIHIPVGDARDARRLAWYQSCTNCFTHPDPAASAVYAQLRERIDPALAGDDSDWRAVLDASTRLHEELTERMHRGRDRLLALASFDPRASAPLIERIEHLDRDERLPAFMETSFDLFGMETEEHSARRLVVRHGEHVSVGAFPQVTDDGLLLTYDRATALAHEDTQFLTWDHPLVASAMDQVTNGEFGNAALAVIKHPTLPPGSSFLELIHIVDCAGPRHRQARRYLRQSVIRLLLDANGKDVATRHPHRDLTRIGLHINKALAKQAINAQAARLKQLIQAGADIARQHLEHIREASLADLKQEFDAEIERLRELAQRNPNIREQDIQALEEQAGELAESIRDAGARLDAIRLIVVGD